MPFGGGPRLCPGRYLALLEIKMVTAMLFRNFRLAAVGTEEGTPVAERLSFTMEPVGLRMRLAMRQGAPALTAP
jgi:cytochrome P450